MRITGLALQHIRTHKQFARQFPKQTTVIIGPNASGKTTIVEAIFLLATGESFRAQKIEELISFGAELGRVKGVVVVGTREEEEVTGESTAPEQVELEVLVTRGEVQGKRTAKRLFSVNGVRRQKATATSHVQAVVFRPEDMRLIEGSPARRRAFLDTVLVAVHPEYDRSLRTYEQTLRRRNKLLQQVREGEQSRSSLQYWNLSLIKHGTILQQHRLDFLQHCAQVAFPVPFEVVYQPSVISDERIEQYLPREIAAGHTLIGPHKDDIVADLPIGGEKRNIALFGSRGQQRLGVLWLKFCEFEYIETKLGDTPLLLLDDILSELDEESRLLALRVARKCQSFITTTEPEVVNLVVAQVPEADREILEFSEAESAWRGIG